MYYIGEEDGCQNKNRSFEQFMLEYYCLVLLRLVRFAHSGDSLPYGRKPE